MVDDRTQLLVVARSAYRRNDWRTSYESFSRVDGVQTLDTDDLAVYASAAWRQGHGRESVRINEQVHTRLLRTDPVQAAMKAAELGLAWLARGHLALARSWGQRAQVLLDGVPETTAHGYLAYLLAVIAADAGEPEHFDTATRQLAVIAKNLDDAALRTLAQALTGTAAVAAGDPAGSRALDQVLLPVLDEPVPVEWAADVYRRALTLAHRQGAGDRVASWAQSMQRWCDATEPESTQSAYRAVCDVHRLSVVADPDPRDLVRRVVGLRRLVADVDAVAASMVEELLSRNLGDHR
ncbi:chemotaxis protein CheY [Mycolicibacterium neworleansense]|uniref:Response regulator containing a CheY-like receiver domain and an HTH DNA-binding domain protein n=1 Tax=Mycolicibacterium neworleansense TaxID=146018 RepID=A0A0H5RIW5_9MYCO|nr:chemotaxis protein CheY [Mycolicibacterium neworleansense]MCV7361900.1 chemotaxis protein CheY [Mycolicibacterium neworleansense]CRZ13696.1 response regulator containing a CheY-like receiver domain and an HTH DNA-binding domain protein [Mycolicibacterium neworleansense]